VKKFQFETEMKVLGKRYAPGAVIVENEIDAGCLQSMLALKQLSPVAPEVAAPTPAPTPAPVATKASEPKAKSK